MGEIIARIEIEALPAQVWAIALDPERLRDWVTIHRHLGRHDGGPVGAGYRMTQTLSLRGAPFRVHWELVRCEEPRLATWHGRGPAHSHAETEYRLTERDGATCFEYRNEFFPPLGLLGRAAQRAVAGDIPRVQAHASLLRLKALCESGR